MHNYYYMSMQETVVGHVLAGASAPDLSRCATVSHTWRHAVAAIISTRRADLSRRTESVPVECVNHVDGEPFPDCDYSSSCVPHESVRMLLEGTETAGCACESGCLSSCTCLAVAGGVPAYDSCGRLAVLRAQTQTLRPPPVMVFECTERCRCRADCVNRVVGHGMRVRLQVFKTSSCGWGVRVLEPLQRGAFVCEYAGELLASSEAKHRRAAAPTGPNYLMVVNERRQGGDGDGAPCSLRTIIDPTVRGNVGRFLNHSCRPNLMHQVVRVGSVVPRVAFFCLRDIAAGEELTFRYGDDGEDEQPAAATPPTARGSRRCECGEEGCRGFLPADREFEADVT